jgi:uncharacterized protein
MAGNVDTVKSGFDAFNSGDIEGVKATWTDDIRWDGTNAEGLPGSGRHEGKDAVVQMLEEITEQWESFEATPDEFFEQDDNVVVLGHLEGRTKNGRDVKAPFVHVWRMQDGKGREVLALTDTLEVARALEVV